LFHILNGWVAGSMLSEADTCREYVLPKLYKAGWLHDQITEQKYFTDGRIVIVGKKHVRKPGKKADYILRYRPDFPIAVVEAYSCDCGTDFREYSKAGKHSFTLKLQKGKGFIKA